MSCGVGCRCGSDPALLWLWRRLAATAPIRPLAWEPPYAVGAAQEKAKRQKKNDPKEFDFATTWMARQLTVTTEWKRGVPVVAQWLTNPTRNHEVEGLVSALAQWVNDPALL